MKIFVTDKYRIFTFSVICAMIALTGIFMKSSTLEEVSSQKRIIPIYSVERNDNKVAVTFDCAWGADDIDSILQTLEKNNCKATFFVLGSWAEKYPDAIKKIYKSGHEIGNHSYNHACYTSLSTHDITADIKKCNKIISDITDVSPVLFRAPSGDYNNDVISACHALNMTYIQWDTDSLDWEGLNGEQMKSRILPNLKSGSIILFHNSTKYTAKSLDSVLTAIQSQGYTFSKVSDLIYKDSYTIDYTGRQFRQ